MARAVAKATAHSAGGAENAAYIGRPQEEHSREPERQPGEEPVGGRGERLAEMREGDSGEARGRAAGGGDDDPVWGWNVPWFVTGEAHGVWETEEGRALLESKSLSLAARHLGLCPAPPDAGKLSVEEKRENLVAHFSTLADLEERQKGLSHFRVILTVGFEVSTGELKAMANDFLRVNFPLCPAFVAIHDDTEHRHAHVYVHARQLDQRRVSLGQDYFRLDESWMEICSKRLNDPEIYERHVELKEETRRWSERAEKARDAGKPLPPKPDRWGDHHDTLLVFRPYDDRWCGRLQAQARVAETRVKWLEATKARTENLTVAREEAQGLRARLDEAAGKRGESKSRSKRAMPAEVVTISEARELLRYERDIQKAEKGKGGRRKQSVPTSRVEQGALRFDEPDVGRGEQTGFEFQSAAELSRERDAARPHARTGPAPPSRERAEATSAVAGAPTPADEAARSFGRELVAEVRLVRTESSLGAVKSVKERRRLKEQLIEDRRAHARAREEATRHRSVLATRGEAEPPYLLRDDERSYLNFMSAQVPERLRERIVAEVARARIISGREEEALALRSQEDSSPAEVYPPSPAKAEPSHPAAGDRKGDETGDTKREPPEELQPARTAPTRPAEITRNVSALLMPDEEVQHLTVEYELARARAGVLRAAEEEFKAAPHQWVSLKYKLSLAAIEEKVARGNADDINVGWLHEVRGCVSDELSVERIQLPSRRRKAEDEARSLEARLSHEMKVRAKLGCVMPDAVPSAEELRELVSCAEAARDARLLRRVFEDDRDRALREADESGSGEPVRLLEERYAGVQLVAEVRADRSRTALTRSSKEPDKTLLPATDETGRDTVATLEQAGTRKGIMGTLGRLVESGGRRRLREQLHEAKDKYFSHLRADAEGREAFLGAALKIASECRDHGLKFGYYVQAVPELSPEQMQEVRAHAVTQTKARSEQWLADCAQSQKQKDERELAAVAAARAARTVEIIMPGATGENLAELSRRELATVRERLSIESQERVNRSVTDRDQPGTPKGPEKDMPDPDRGGGGYRGR